MEDANERNSGVSKLTVSVRIRPLAPKDFAKENVQTTARALDDTNVIVTEPTPETFDDHLRKDRPKERIYAFDRVFGENATQEEVFQGTVENLVHWVVDGFNATVFAYGATAGKTYSMLGNDTEPGIINLTLRALFAVLKHNGDQPEARSKPKKGRQPSSTPSTTYTVSLTFLEIYNENIRDLLSGVSVPRADYLDLREDPTRGVVVSGITSVRVRDVEEILAVLKKRNRYRTQEATGANEASSRSHAVLQVLVGCATANKTGKRTERYGKLSMIDLAGSERAAETKNRGLRMIEGANINRSLLALGNCITALADTSKRGKYVNYRDSKLTRLLKDSLGGNCRTVMIANISPASTSFDETLNTLKYATRARTIKTKVTQQVSTKYEPYNATIQQLQGEIGVLKDRLTRAESTHLLADNPIRAAANISARDLFQTQGPGSKRSSVAGRPRYEEKLPPLHRPGTKESTYTTIQQRRSVGSINEPANEAPSPIFSQLRTVLERAFARHQESFKYLIAAEEDLEDEAELDELRTKVDGIEDEIRHIQKSLPTSLDAREREILDLTVRLHFFRADNEDLQHVTQMQRLVQSQTKILMDASMLAHQTALDRVLELQKGAASSKGGSAVATQLGSLHNELLANKANFANGRDASRTLETNIQRTAARIRQRKILDQHGVPTIVVQPRDGGDHEANISDDDFDEDDEGEMEKNDSKISRRSSDVGSGPVGKKNAGTSMNTSLSPLPALPPNKNVTKSQPSDRRMDLMRKAYSVSKPGARR
ncbi:P-loop containing nucleoside triphosphate hydrolase protein [Fimicolochytrium jonesii]|uniref:P-loop containing nucleoside triphosphate hydrolase protein n=1 Tax=Fimicolochytrium jonesii TaxID=1396493 RepID=UPI0022FE4CC7|nr:P-loop containing nucleoside triphosphate hydrolase protein [Fimicolochytrium jonesii]KAI8824335.1 P-loop containing nucleoside triphosphate hydrolase protein [Fimicolochytrium jonesii]